MLFTKYSSFIISTIITTNKKNNNDEDPEESPARYQIPRGSYQDSSASTKYRPSRPL